ncbi:MAG: hypothetical protein MZV65_23575 [Chromatiales bacterium]|nr:hypothetical protein [Chromatiales bacterium]
MKLFKILERMEAEKEPEEISVLLSGEALRCLRGSVSSKKALGLIQATRIGNTESIRKTRIFLSSAISTLQRVNTLARRTCRHLGIQMELGMIGGHFNAKIGNVDRVREIARSVLKIAPEITLESYNESESKQILTEDISSSADGKIAYVFLHMA